MKWLKNLENIIDHNKPEDCPCCGSLNTEYSAKEVKNNYGFCVIWCNDCKNAYNVSRMKINDNFITDKKFLTDLIFNCYRSASAGRLYHKTDFQNG